MRQTHFYEPSQFEIKKKLCPSESIEINGTTYDQNNPIGTETFEDGSILSCDSIVNISLSFYQSAELLIVESLCQQSQIVVNNEIFNSNNPYGEVVLAGAAFNGCDSIIQVDLDFIPNPYSFFHDTLWEGESLRIHNTTFYKDFPNGEVTLPNAASNGCDSVIQVDLVFLEKQYFVPNAFSPNGDGFNDTFTIFGGETLKRIRSLKVFNRWGMLVFEEFDFLPNDLNKGWNGKVNEQDGVSGVYLFISEIEYGDGTTDLISGDFVLLR